MRATRSLVPLLLFLAAAGCTVDEAPPEPGAALKPTWEAVEESALSAGESAQFTAAAAARDALAKGLMLRLLEGMESGGAPAAIDVCKTVAPEIAGETSQTLGVKIGRTASKLRNPENAPPAWAKPYVDAQRAETVLLRNGSDGTLAVLFPIKLQSQCIQCHGPEARILPAVRDALKAAYPDDEATGFSEGDLRGWFHVTVPAAT